MGPRPSSALRNWGRPNSRVTSRRLNLSIICWQMPEVPNATGRFWARKLRWFALPLLVGQKVAERLTLIAQHYEQIQWIRLGDAQHRENRMSLPSMVCFMIEEMGEYFATTLPLRGAI